MTKEELTEKVKELPDLPGVYIMYNAEGKIIYVGKAISLRKRVRQYFDNNKNKGAKVLAMVSHIDHFEYIIVGNEVEALVLESNLIKKNRPKYNIVLRDDKQYPYIKLTDEKFPRLLKVRQVKDDGSYYGPYPDAYAVNDTIDLLKKSYKLRSCNLNFERGDSLDRPCLYYYIHRCDGACIGKADEGAYMEKVGEIRDFLEGKSDKIPNQVLAKMNEASKNQDYEEAAGYRDSYRALSVIRQKQKITDSSSSSEDLDIIAMSKGLSYVTVMVFFMRGGKIIDRQHFTIKDDYKDEKKDIMSSFIKQFYLNIVYIPKEILLEVEPDDLEAIGAFLSAKKKSKVYIHQPKLGRKKELVDMAQENATEMMEKYERLANKGDRKKGKGLEELGELLNLPNLQRIEAYDISNTSGVQSVGSMVVFENGFSARKEYRKFKIKTVEGPNDYASLQEVLERRFKRGIKEKAGGHDKTGFGHFPDLILMDGGKGQVSAAQEVLYKLGLSIEIAGLVKDDKHTTRAIVYQGEEIPVKKSSQVYKLIYAIQEEAHRFAINYHRKLMEKSMKKSELDSIKGVGEVTKKNLYDHFKTINKMRAASVEELMEVPLVGKKQALEIYKHFRLEK